MDGKRTSKPQELRALSKADLTKQLEELKQELASLRVQKIAGGSASKLTKISTVRKSIARVLTVLTSQQRTALRKFYEGKKYLPLDLRAKKTRAQRRALSKKDASRVTLRTKKIAQAFPAQKYALRA